jgi:hypothetical protein
LGIDERWWNLGTTVFTGALLFLTVSADVTRLGVGILLRRRYWLAIPVYAVVAGIATQLPRVVLEVIYGLRHGFSASVIVGRIMDGLRAGGTNVAMMVAAILVLLATLSSIRVCAVGEHSSRRGLAAQQSVVVLIAVGAFTIASLSRADFILSVLAIIVTISVAYAVSLVLMNRCTACRRRRVSALFLRSRCACGQDALAALRRLTTHPYEPEVDSPPREARRPAVVAAPR